MMTYPLNESRIGLIPTLQALHDDFQQLIDVDEFRHECHQPFGYVKLHATNK